MSDPLRTVGEYYERVFAQERRDRFDRFDALPKEIKDAFLERYGSGLGLAIKTIPLNMLVQQLALALFMSQDRQVEAELQESVRKWLRKNGWEE